jgi:hypothetical protein
MKEVGELKKEVKGETETRLSATLEDGQNWCRLLRRLRVKCDE